MGDTKILTGFVYMIKMTINEEIEYLKSGDWYDKIRNALTADEYNKLGWVIGDIIETIELLRSLTPVQTTNADYIGSMSDEELAEFLVDFKDCSTDCLIIKCEKIATGFVKQAIRW